MGSGKVLAASPENFAIESVRPERIVRPQMNIYRADIECDARAWRTRLPHCHNCFLTGNFRLQIRLEAGGRRSVSKSRFPAMIAQQAISCHQVRDGLLMFH